MSELSPQTHISSLVVFCRPACFEQTEKKLHALSGVEVCATDHAGKFVVLLETSNEQEILASVKRIEQIDGVLNAIMVYHEIDDNA